MLRAFPAADRAPPRARRDSSCAARWSGAATSMSATSLGQGGDGERLVDRRAHRQMSWSAIAATAEACARGAPAGTGANATGRRWTWARPPPPPDRRSPHRANRRRAGRRRFPMRRIRRPTKPRQIARMDAQNPLPGTSADDLKNSANAEKAKPKPKVVKKKSTPADAASRPRLPSRRMPRQLPRATPRRRPA